jgi:hypothetical protein
LADQKVMQRESLCPMNVAAAQHRNHGVVAATAPISGYTKKTQLGLVSLIGTPGFHGCSRIGVQEIVSGS